MSQKIEIGVTANTGGAESGIQKVDAAAAGAAAAVDDIANASRSAAAELDDMAKRADRVAKAVDEINKQRAILSRHMGRDISLPDTAQFISNFENMRSGPVIGVGKAVRNSRGFEDWLENYQRSFVNPKDAEAHRRRIIEYGMQGTDYARTRTLPPDPGPGEPPPSGGGGGGGGGGGSGAIQRSQSMALSFGKGMLGLAGITSIMGMAGQAVDLATEEAVGIDTLKRRSGDLGVSFSKLQDQVRSAGDGMGITYVESVRLAQEYAKISGQFRNASGLRTSEGFSRAFGMDPATSVQFFATMQRLRAPGADDQGSRRLALMIGEAVSKGGYGGKAEEVLAAITGLATEMTRQTLGAPNIGAIAGYLTTLTKSGFPGLDPAGAASLLGAADASVRRGGGMGDASLNFSYAALAKASPGMNVVQAGALWQAGLFGTTRNVFGAGDKDGPGTPLGDWAKANGLSVPGANDTTTLTKEMGLLHRQYAGKGAWYMLDAMKNQFGLNYGQAAALDLMYQQGPENLGESQRLVGAAGLDMSKLSANGMYGVGKVAAAKTHSDLKALYKDVIDRKDIGDQEKSGLTAAFNKGDSEQIKQALTKIIGTHDQEETDGSKTRQSISDLKDALTTAGGPLLAVLNPIRVAVERLAEHFAPDTAQREKQSAAQKQEESVFKGRAAGMQQHFGDIHSLASARGVKVTDEQRKAILDAAHGDKGIAADVENALRWENRGFGAPRDATSSRGAQGFFQLLPKTFADMGTGGNIHNFADGARAAAEYMRRARKRFGSNSALVGAAYDGGMGKADWISKGGVTHIPELADYMAGFSALGNTPLPDGDPNGRSERARASVHVTVGGESHVIVKDSSGKVHGTAAIKPFVSKPPTGQAAAWVGGMSMAALP